MATRSRTRRTIDVGRLREAMSAPGADPRSWVVLARVDDDPDAIRWEPGTGWLVDVTVGSGELAGEDMIVCRVGSGLGGTSHESRPVPRGAEVVVVFPAGDPNVSPVIIDYVHNPTDSAVPSEVNGTPVDEARALSTMLTKTTAGVDAELGAQVRIRAVAAADGSIELTLDGPGDITIRATGPGNVRVIADGGEVRLQDASTPLEGVVQGQAIDTFTGLTQFALGNASTKVLAKKG